MMEWMKDFFLWDSKDEGNTCTLAPIQGFERTFRLNHGSNLLDVWSPDIYFKMDPQFPKNIGLADNLQNFDGVVVSKFLKEFLEKKRLKNMEYLPVAIMNHKGKISSRDYFVVNPLIPQDCIDLEKSEPTYYAIAPAKIEYVKRLVIDPKKLDPEVHIFRVKNFQKAVLIRAVLAKEISAGPFTGVRWLNPLEIDA